jgi:hypothetical protein
MGALDQDRFDQVNGHHSSQRPCGHKQFSECLGGFDGVEQPLQRGIIVAYAVAEA